MKQGDRVKVVNRWPIQWWQVGGVCKKPYGDTYPEFLTGVISKICKNGNVHYACEQMKNGSEDGLRTMIAKSTDVVCIL